MSAFWSTVLGILIFICVIANYLLIRWVAKPINGEKSQGEGTGHVWDGNLTELNNPMPRWWLILYYITIVYGGIYLAYYGGYGDNDGLGDWSSVQEYNEEVAEAEKQYGPIFSKFSSTSIEELSEDKDAQKVGQRLFVTYCAQCHGSDAGGARGFPNLTDNDWLWGGETAEIKHSIMNGRTGSMPAWGTVLQANQIEYVTEYTLSLSGRNHKATDAQRGAEIFTQYCAACHGVDGKGNKFVGAPNLTDKVWLYGASKRRIIQTITEGRTGQMPAHKNFLGEDKVHLLAAYVYGLKLND
jgi:cytochrome c oxidase cbb3-type subunit 3